MEHPELAAGALHLLALGLADLLGASGVEQHPHPESGACAFGQRIGQPLPQLALKAGFEPAKIEAAENSQSFMR